MSVSSVPAQERVDPSLDELQQVVCIHHIQFRDHTLTDRIVFFVCDDSGALRELEWLTVPYLDLFCKSNQIGALLRVMGVITGELFVNYGLHTDSKRERCDVTVHKHPSYHKRT